MTELSYVALCIMNTANERRTMPLQSRPRIIFVGAFTATENGTWGGQVQACQSLCKEADATTDVQWILIDTRMKTLPPPSIVIRAWCALVRTMTLVTSLLTQRIDGVLIFTGMFPTGVLEKGMMCLIARAFGKRVILAPRSEVRKFRGAARILKPFFEWVLWSCRGVICQSVEAKQRLKDEFRCPEHKLCIVPAWIDTTPYNSIAKRRVRRTDGASVTFLYLGWFVKYKGVYELLAAFDGVCRRTTQSCRLILCGHGEEVDRMKAWVNDRNLTGRVEFRGWVDLRGKLDALEASDVFVLPSHTEGLPNALMEAMASKLPCITTPVGGIPSLIQHDVNGLLIPPQNEQALESAMLKLLSDPDLAVCLAARGMDCVESKHQLRGAFAKIADLLEIQTIAPCDIPATISCKDATSAIKTCGNDAA
jgi:glycosyltransferase involved in cell wall biosynthesis